MRRPNRSEPNLITRAHHRGPRSCTARARRAHRPAVHDWGLEAQLAADHATHLRVLLSFLHMEPDLAAALAALGAIHPVGRLDEAQVRALLLSAQRRRAVAEAREEGQRRRQEAGVLPGTACRCGHLEVAHGAAVGKAGWLACSVRECDCDDLLFRNIAVTRRRGPLLPNVFSSVRFEEGG